MVEDALDGDGYGVESTPGSLARWGDERYGGSVLSAAPPPPRRPRGIEPGRELLLLDPTRGAAGGRRRDLGPGQHGIDGRPVRHLQPRSGPPDAGPEGSGSGMNARPLRHGEPAPGDGPGPPRRPGPAPVRRGGRR